MIIGNKTMAKFEEALKAMREGNKAKVARLSPNYIYLENDCFYFYDGLYNIPCGFLKTDFILAEDWEIIDE